MLNDIGKIEVAYEVNNFAFGSENIAKKSKVLPIKKHHKMPPVPDVTSYAIYNTAKDDYLKICKEIPHGDFSSAKAEWADELCARLLEFELLNGVPV